MLPTDFLDQMRAMLGHEFTAFVESFQQERTYGLRVNTLKISVADFLQLVPFKLEPVPWSAEGFYYLPQDEPGKHPYHDAGLYYIQEPSAMVVATLLDPQPDELVLDLAAAPGGKTTHIAAKMQGHGLLVANEIDFARAKVISQNIERLAIGNCIVCSARPDFLAAKYGGIFDRVLLDAPCSGEGMFRKEPGTIAEWSMEHVIGCAARQRAILDSAADLVRPGGRLVYSTCTFESLENEGVIESFLAKHPEFSLEKTVRLWPHQVRGEGHFIAVLTKGGSSLPAFSRWRPTYLHRTELLLVQRWWEEHCLLPIPSEIVKFGDRLYQLPADCPDLSGLRILRPGLELGSLRTNRFEPAHALAHSLTPGEVRNSLVLAAESAEVSAYLRGETLTHSGPSGWCLVNVDGYSLGWGKIVGTTLKNHYPKGLRRR